MNSRLAKLGMEKNRPLLDGQHPKQGLDKSGFADPVGSEEEPEFSRLTSRLTSLRTVRFP